MLSDMRAKDDIRDAGPELDEALGKMGHYQYEYNIPGQPKGTQTGTMAQELASSKAGSKLVGQYPSGGLGVKIPEATNFALAGLSRLNERLESVENGQAPRDSMVFGDAQFREPGGDAAWTIREEPDFLLAKNDRTNELRKIMTEPLNANEHSQAVNRPHGAGPIDGRRVAASNGTFGDGMLGGIMGGGSSSPAPAAAGISPQAAASPGMMGGGVGGVPLIGAQAPASMSQGGGQGSSALGTMGDSLQNMGKQYQASQQSAGLQQAGTAAKLDAASMGAGGDLMLGAEM